MRAQVRLERSEYGGGRIALRFERQVAEEAVGLSLNPTMDKKQKSEKRSFFEEFETAIF